LSNSGTFIRGRNTNGSSRIPVFIGSFLNLVVNSITLKVFPLSCSETPEAETDMLILANTIIKVKSNAIVLFIEITS
jgi:hypothetical protein